MNALLTYVWIWIAFIAMSFWESSVEGRKAWDKEKVGFKIKIPKVCAITQYHFFLAWIMLPMLIVGLPLIIYGWNISLFFILLSAFFSGLVIEDFFWYVVNQKVKLKELYTPFSDYYPWLKINGKKVLPLFYILGIALAIAFFILS